MSSRLSRALRELASALEEADKEEETSWELVGESSHATRESPATSQKEQVPDSSGAPGTTATASHIAYRGDWRIYIIVAHPNQKLGLVEGPGSSTWKKIEATLPNARLVGSGARLRRVQNHAEAARVWRAAHGEKPMPVLEL